MEESPHPTLPQLFPTGVSTKGLALSVLCQPGLQGAKEKESIPFWSAALTSWEVRTAKASPFFDVPVGNGNRGERDMEELEGGKGEGCLGRSHWQAQLNGKKQMMTSPQTPPACLPPPSEASFSPSAVSPASPSSSMPAATNARQVSQLPIMH